MVVALDVSAARPEAIWSGLSPLAELMACLHVIAEPDHHPESRQWWERVNASSSETLRSDLLRFAPLWARYRMRLFYPTSKDLNRDVKDEIGALESTDDHRFLPLVADAIRGRRLEFEGPDQVLGDPTWVRECEQRSFARGDLAHSLVHDHRRFRADLVATLHRCVDEFFAQEWEDTHVVMERAHRRLQGSIARVAPAQLVASVSGIASTRGSPGMVYFDKLQSRSAAVGEDGLVLVPSVRAWPHVMVKHDPALPVVVHYLAQADADSGAESQEDLRRRLSALAEPSRWELCRHLIGETITTGELAIRTGLPKSAVSRHLRSLREAGLVISQKDGRHVYHRVHPSAIVHIGHDVLRGLIR